LSPEAPWFAAAHTAVDGFDLGTGVSYALQITRVRRQLLALMTSQVRKI